MHGLIQPMPGRNRVKLYDIRLLVCHQCTEVRFVSFLSGGFTTMAVINLLESKLAKRISLQLWNCENPGPYNSTTEVTLRIKLKLLYYSHSISLCFLAHHAQALNLLFWNNWNNKIFEIHNTFIENTHCMISKILKPWICWTNQNKSSVFYLYVVVLLSKVISDWSNFWKFVIQN